MFWSIRGISSSRYVGLNHLAPNCSHMELDLDSQPIACGAQYSADCPPKTWTPPPDQRQLSYLGPSSGLLAPADEHVDSGTILNASMSNIPLDRSLPEVNCFSDGVFGPVLTTEFMPSSESRRPKRGPFQDATLRMETADMRKIGSCIRCKTQRIRVSGKVPLIVDAADTLLVS